MKSRNKKVQIVQDPEAPLPTEVMAQSIIDLSEAARQLLNGRLKRAAIVVLLKDQTDLPKAHINDILDALESLKSDWLNK
jgi:uncharacterized protein involved in propanediol utilization